MTIPVGEKLWIKGHWDTRPVPAGRVAVLLKPSSHVDGWPHQASTLAMLTALDTLVLEGQSVVDIGSGSAILSIAAARLGASKVYALDIDPAAIAHTQETIAVNNLANIVQVLNRSLLGTAPIADIILCNLGMIPDGPLLHDMGAAMKPGAPIWITAPAEHQPSLELAMLSISCALIRIPGAIARSDHSLYCFRKFTSSNA